MRLLDTNVILRFLLNDHPVQSPQVQARLAGDDVFTVAPHILVEVAVVLEKVYGVGRPQLVLALQTFLAQDNLEVLGFDKLRIHAALDLCQPSKRVSFADALLWAEAGRAGGATVLTFDERFPSQHPDPMFAAVPLEEP